jgi:hypothetical protein
MSLDLTFPSFTFTETELVLLAEAFSNPTVKKYLIHLSSESAKDLLSLPTMQHQHEYKALAHAETQGRLAVIETLLSLEAPQLNKLNLPLEQPAQ